MVLGTQSGKLFYIEALRLLGCLSVIVLHVINAVQNDPNLLGTKTWWVTNALNAVTRLGVPIFFMISGYLALSSTKNEPIGVMYRKKAVQLLCPLVGWSVVYYVYNGVTNQAPMSIGDFLTKFTTQDVSYHFWFVYVLFFMVLFTPFFKKMVQNATDAQLWWLLLLIVFPTTIRPMINHTFGIWLNFFNPMIEGYVGFFILGYILGTRPLGAKALPWVYAGGIVGVLLGSIGTFMLSDSQHIDTFYNGGYQLNNYLVAMAVFVFCQRNAHYIHYKSVQKIVVALGGMSYSIYLVHVLVLKEWIARAGLPTTAFSIVVYAIGTFVVSVAIIWVCGKVNQTRIHIQNLQQK